MVRMHELFSGFIPLTLCYWYRKSSLGSGGSPVRTAIVIQDDSLPAAPPPQIRILKRPSNNGTRRPQDLYRSYDVDDGGVRAAGALVPAVCSLGNTENRGNASQSQTTRKYSHKKIHKNTQKMHKDSISHHNCKSVMQLISNQLCIIPKSTVCYSGCCLSSFNLPRAKLSHYLRQNLLKWCVFTSCVNLGLPSQLQFPTSGERMPCLFSEEFQAVDQNTRTQNVRCCSGNCAQSHPHQLEGELNCCVFTK